MKKKKVFIVLAIVVVLLILLTPIRRNLKDGGSVSYKSLLYEVKKIHQLAGADGVKPYIDGYEIKILGMTIYKHTNEAENTIKKTEEDNSLYAKTADFLEKEFHRVYDPYYDIQNLIISDWNENGHEATFFYKMEWLNYNRDPDTVEYIQKAKEAGGKQYETLYNDYLALKEANYEFKVVLNGDNIELYSNVSPKGVEWQPTKVDDYVLSK